LHQETLSDAFDELKGSVEFIINAHNSSAGSISDILSAIIAESEIHSPSVLFGLESALIDLQASVLNVPPYQVLDPSLSCRTILINGLITEQDNLNQRIERMIAEGYTALKLKVGKTDLKSESTNLKACQNLISRKISMRLDANRAWNLSEALEFSRSIPLNSIEYIEEPLSNPHQLKDFQEQTGMAVALDESLLELKEAKEIPPWCAAIIIKPALIGGIQRSLEWIKSARRLNIKSVISDTFCSAVGLAMHTNLAALAAGNKIAMGLDTFHRFSTNIIPMDNVLKNGSLDLVLLNERRKKLNFNILKRLE
jgi:O-succinylbenzoate synthase